MLNVKKNPIVILDEIQKVPELMDYCQLLIDAQQIQFLLTGSSTRKIKNLLPGRVIKKTLSILNPHEVDVAAQPLSDWLCSDLLPGI